jgi:hypothetical protein
MALETDLSQSPYYDDYNANNNFYRVLYRPGTAVQTRELNQMQSILQDQIDKFGRHIFTEGSVVEGCSFTFDKNYNYVKINDNYVNGTAISAVSDFNNKYIFNENGLRAVVVNTVTGYQSKNPDLNTLYIKYINVGNFPGSGINQTVFANGETLSVVTLSTAANSTNFNTLGPIGNVTVATVTSSVGQGYAFNTTSGVIFQKGFFTKVPAQTLIVSKYDNNPDNISVGFNSVETIVSPESDTSLLDNASGAPNYAAPGAHRLKLVPTLYTTPSSEQENIDAFFSLVDFKNGVPVTIRNTPEYNILGKQLAQRTYETSGNYIINPFLLSTEEKSTDDIFRANNVNLISSRGLGYVEGYRVEFINNSKATLRKGTDTEIVKSQIVSANYGNYVYVNELAGDFDTERMIKVELHKGTIVGNNPNVTVGMQAVTARRFLNSGYSTDRIIGSAYVKSLAFDTGRIGSGAEQYRLYLFNIAMNPGESFSDVRSVVRYSGGAINAVADIVLVKNYSLQKDIAILSRPMLDTMIFPLGQTAIKQINNIQFVYRNKAITSANEIKSNGTMTLSLDGQAGATEKFNVAGLLSANETRNFIVIPTETAYSTNFAGVLSIDSASSNLIGSGTNFDTNFDIGDFIDYGSGTIGYINFIANSSLITLREPAVAQKTSVQYKKIFPKGIPFDFTKPGRSINVNTSINVATFDLDEPNLLSKISTVVYYDVLRSGEKPIKKTLRKNVFVKIDCFTHPAGATGPWPIGFPDVYRINAIYINNSGNYDEPGTTADISDQFTSSTGRSDNLYDMCYLRPKGLNSAGLTTESTLLIDLDIFEQDRSEGVSFFTGSSYPVDDVNVANSQAITTQEIPTYTSTSGITYDLRDSLDFRKYIVATAYPTSNYTVATTNPVDDGAISFTDSGSYLPSPDSNWQGDVEHYLPRKDLAVINTKGRLRIIEGVSATLPKAPSKPSGSMVLGTVNVPPFPSLTSSQASDYNRYDYAITTNITQNKRYTMADIGTLSTRIDNLEYYTSLNLLEQSTNSLLVKNSTTGLNRFKNGILVDPFAGHDIGNTLDPNYNIAIDPKRKEMRPAFYQRTEIFRLDPTLSRNVKQTGSLITLDYTPKKYISQGYASKYRNCIEGNIFVWKTDVVLKPNYQTTPDISTNPDVVNNLDLSQNFINLKNAWGTQWGNWETVQTGSVASVGNKQETSSTTDNVGNVHKSYAQQTVTTTSTTQKQTGTQLEITGYNDTKMNLGTFVQDVSIQPYISSSTICFSAIGMRPGAKIYAYFNNIAVSSWCYPTTASFERGTGNYGDQLTVGDDGSIFGVFVIPPKQFQATELQFMLCDTDNLTTGSGAITTQATGTFYATNLSIAKGTSYLNTRVPVLDYTQVTQQQTIVTSVTNTDRTNDVIAGPPLPAPPIPIINNWNINQNFITNNLSTYNSYNTTKQNVTNVTNVWAPGAAAVVNTLETPYYDTWGSDVSSGYDTSGSSSGYESGWGDDNIGDSVGDGPDE